MDTERFDERPPRGVPDPREFGRGSRSWFRYDAEYDPALHPRRGDLEQEALELDRLDDPRAYEGRGEYSVPRRDPRPGYPAWLPDVGGAPHEWDRLPEWQPPPAFESDLREQYREAIGPDFRGPDFRGPDFRGPDFRGPDFRGPDFRGPDFRGPDFRGPDFRGIGPKDYRRPDESIHEEVSQRLTDAPDVDASSIECHVENGEVRLTGIVRDRDVKYRVEEIAAAVRGVTHVQNDLRLVHKHHFWPASKPDPEQGWMHGIIG